MSGRAYERQREEVSAILRVYGKHQRPETEQKRASEWEGRVARVRGRGGDTEMRGQSVNTREGGRDSDGNWDEKVETERNIFTSLHWQ